MLDKEGAHEEDATKAYRAAHDKTNHADDVVIADHVYFALIDRVEAMLQNLEKEIDDMDAKIGDRWRILDRDYDEKVTYEEVASATMYLKDTWAMRALVSKLSKDKDGKIFAEDIVKLGSRAEDSDTTEEREI